MEFLFSEKNFFNCGQAMSYRKSKYKNRNCSINITQTFPQSDSPSNFKGFGFYCCKYCGCCRNRVNYQF